MKKNKMRPVDRKAKIKKGKRRHAYLQSVLCKQKRCFVKSLSRVLDNLTNNKRAKLRVYPEVPFPGMKIDISSRADLVFYLPESLIIIHEYKTTELQRVSAKLKQQYYDQVNRCSNNFLRTVNVASRQPRFKRNDNDDASAKSVELYKLLTIRNYSNKKKITDETEIIRPSISLPNLKYDKIIQSLYNKTLFD